MRRLTAVLAATAVLIALAGCSAGAEPASWAQRNSEFTVLGSTVSAADTDTSGMPGLAANSVPQDALKGIPGADDVVVASGTPAITREQAIEASRPKDGRLVSAVDVLLPAKFVAAVRNNRKGSKPTMAWIVTWAGVTLHPTGAVGSKPVQILDGKRTAVVDATTGEQLLLTEYGGHP